MKVKYVVLFFIFNFISYTLFAQVINDSTESKKNFGVIGAPILSHSPETDWSFGLAGLFYFYLENPDCKDERLSSVYSNIHYTTKKQFTVKAEYDFYFSKDIYRIYGDIAYSKYPFQFYGIGNNTSANDEENYTPRFLRFKLNVNRKILNFQIGKISAGIRLDYRDDKILKKEEGKKLLKEDIPGNNGGINSGFGLSINFDSRDNSFSTTHGDYLDIKSTFYGKFVASDFSYQRYTVDIRKFFSVNLLDTTHVFAIQVFTDIVDGTTPFYLLPTFGGEMNLRGIYLGRFRDKNSFFMQGEYRFPVFWRFGLTIFGGIGEAFSQIDSFSMNGLKLAGGIGIRGSVIPEEKISVRIDFGFSKYRTEFYLSFNEAF